MDEMVFERFLEREKLTKGGRDTRMSKARSAEKIIGRDLDIVVANDDDMYNSLVVLNGHENPAKKPLSNALRKYYKCKNGRTFPQLVNYKR